jgi:hypothetical protein
MESKNKDLKAVFISAGPSVVDGRVSRIVNLSEGSGRAEPWIDGAWVGDEVNWGAFFETGTLSPTSLARRGVPESELPRTSEV